ncbi:VOC family protein [Zavarzinia sp. CC-PAN008]|uniref:VOC family protein n=1 Tax=Zavarzinia sp. CC-PAN008 TaxID=3243332 RepID=UPI003F745E81
MDLAKPRIDVGLFTTNIEPLLDFWQNRAGVPFDHILPMGNGLFQHRHDLLGSVLKVNHAKGGLQPLPPSGYARLLIAREGQAVVEDLADPDGNAVSLVPPGTRGVERIGVVVKVADVAAQERFYAQALGLERTAHGGFRIGDSVLLVENGGPTNPGSALEGPGWRYITVQVMRCDVEHAKALAGGGEEAMAPVTLGKIARISMIRDPHGNWIELSQRANLTGSLEP